MVQVCTYYQAGRFQFPFFALCLPRLLLQFQVSDVPCCLVTTEYLCVVKYFCVIIRTKLWHTFMASTNLVTLSGEALCSFLVKLWLICISHRTVPSSRAFCLFVFLFIVLQGCCGLCFGNCPKWKSQGVALATGKQEHRVCSKRRGIGKVAFLFILLQFLLGTDYCVVLILTSQLKFCTL